MAGLLDTLVRKNAEEARAKQIDSGALSTIPAPPPELGQVQMPVQDFSRTNNATAGEGSLGIDAGVNQTSAMLKNAVSAAAQAVSQPELAANVRKSALKDEEAAAATLQNSTAPQSLKDVGSVDDFGKYLVSGVMRNMPQLGVMGAGALLTRGRALGVAAPSAAMNAGDVYGEGQGEIDKLVAAGQLDPAREQQMRHQVLVNTGIAAPIMAALDTYGFSKIFGTPALKAGAAKVIADSLPAHVRKALLAEGGTEAVQEYIGLTANKLALERPEAFGLTKDDVWRLADAGVLGAAAGGTFAVPGHIAAPLARAAGQTVDAGIDAATAFMRPEEPTPGAAGGGSPPGAGPSAGTRAGDFMRAVVDLDTPAVQKFAQDAFDAAMNNEAVQNAAKQGGDFWSAFSKGKRFARAEAFWDQHAPEAEAGFNQFVAGIGDTAQTGDMKAMFERYKEALARTMPGMPDIDIDRTDVDKAARGAGRKIGDAIAGFNTAAARTPGFVDGIVNGAKKQAAAATGAMNDAVASAKSAVESGAQSAVDGMENLSGNIREFGERLDAENRTSQVDPASFATGNTYEPDDSPLDASQAKRVAQSLLTRIRPEQPPGKQSVVMSNDAKAIARTLADHAPGLRNTDFLNKLARGFEGLVNNPALFKSKLNDPQIATTIRMLFNLRPDELAQSLMSDLRADKEPSTQNDALSYVGDPNYATNAVLASEAKRVEDTGATVDGEVIADTETGEIKDAPERAPVEESNLDPTLPGVRERETFKKMIATPEQKEAAAKGRQKGMQWVIVTETVRDPDTGEVVKQTSRPGQVNLMNMARSQAGERRAVEGATTQQRSDTNFLESVGALFNGWTETNAAGQPVEYHVHPATQRENGGELTAIPRGGLEGWLRDNSLIGFAKDKDGNAAPRTFGQLKQAGISSVTVTKNEIPSFAERSAKFLDDAPQYDAWVEEAKTPAKKDRARGYRERAAASLGKAAAYFVRGIQNEDAARKAVAETIEYLDAAPEAAVDELWRNMEDGTVENRAAVLAAMQEAAERNNPAPLRGYAPDVYKALSARNSRALMSVQLLSSEIRDAGAAKIEAVLQDHLIEKYEQAPKEDRDITAVDPTEPAPARDIYNGFEEVTRPDGSRTTRSVKTNTISGKAGTLAQDEEGVITEDMAGDYIDHGAAVDREIAGKRRAEAEEKRAAKAKQSVVKAKREAARAEPEREIYVTGKQTDDGSAELGIRRKDTITDPQKVNGLIERLLTDAQAQRLGMAEVNMQADFSINTKEGRFVIEYRGDHAVIGFEPNAAAPEVAAKGPKGQAPSGRLTEGALRESKKFSLEKSRTEKELARVLAANGFALEDGVPNTDALGTLIDLATKKVSLSSDPASLRQAAEGLSMLMVGHADFEALRPQIQATQLYKDEFAKLQGTRVRAAPEAARRVLARLIADNFQRRADVDQGLLASLAALARRVWTVFVEKVAPELTTAVNTMVDKMLADSGYLARPDKPGYVPVRFQEAVDSDPLAGQILAVAAESGVGLTGSLAYAAQTRILRPKNAAIHDLDFIAPTNIAGRAFFKALVKQFPQARVVNTFQDPAGHETNAVLIPPPGTKFVALTRSSYKLVNDKGEVVGSHEKRDGKEVTSGLQAKPIDIFVRGKMEAPVTHKFKVAGKEHTIQLKSVTEGMASKLNILREKDVWDFQRYNPNTKFSRENVSGDLDLTTPEVAAKGPKGQAPSGQPTEAYAAHSESGEISVSLLDTPAEVSQARLEQLRATINRVLTAAGVVDRDVIRGFKQIIRSVDELVRAGVYGEAELFTLNWEAHDAVTLAAAALYGTTGANIQDTVTELQNAIFAPLVPLTDAEIDSVRARVAELLGDRIKLVIAPVLFEVGPAALNTGGLSSYDEPAGKEYIGLSTILAGGFSAGSTPGVQLMQTAHHEVMHSVLVTLARDYGADVVQKIIDAAQAPHIRDQVLKNAPNDVLREYFAHNPEEMLVEAYGQWAVGRLRLNAGSKLYAFFTRVREVVQALFGKLSEDALLAEVFAATNRGELKNKAPATLDDVVNARKASRESGNIRYLQAAPKKFSRENVNGDLDLTTPEGREEARKAIREIAGKVGIKFGDENSYDWEGHVITLAARKDGSLTTAFHEALHAIFKSIAPEDKATLYEALNAPHVRKQLRELLKDSPEAIEAFTRDSEELAAYAFQFWKMGMLDLNPQAKNWFGKIVDLVDKALAWLKDQPTANELFARIARGYYKDGGPSPAEIAYLKSQRAHDAMRSVTGMITRGMTSLYTKVLTPMDDRLRETGIGELHEIARLLYTQVGEEGDARGLAQAVPAMSKKFLNDFGKIVHGDPKAALTALRAIATDTANPTDPKVVQIRSFLNKMHRYMTDAGVEVGFIENYLPLQWSGDTIAADEAGFTKLMKKYEKELRAINKDLTPRLAWKMMSQRNLSRAIPTGDVFDEHGVPTAHHTQERIFSFLSNAEREPYTEPDLIGTMSQYIKQTVKRAEHARRFGDKNEILKKLLTAAEARGATKEQIELVQDYIDAVHGAKFAKMDPSLRKVVGAVQTYQNFRVLGLAIFSSVTDPLVLAVRSGEFKEAWGAYKNVVTTLLGTRNPAELQQLGEDIGAIEARGIEDAVLGMYGGFEVEGDLKKLNDLFFTYNGMNGLTKSLRVYALGAGQRFIAKHAKAGNDRMLRELGLDKADVHFMPDGSLAVRGTQYRALGLNPMDALKIQNALNRFVDESVLHPNAGERPGWGNDPLWGLLFHLKQFIFSFHKVVSKKVAHELESGNHVSALHAAAFVPIMAASGFMREAIQTAGAIPASHDFMYYLGLGANRSGFMGPSALAHDAFTSVAQGRDPLGAVGGPTVDQALDAVSVLANPDRIGRFIEEAMPLSSIYKRW